MLPGLDCGGFDLIWCDGSVTPEGRALPSPNHFQNTPVKGIWLDINGGPDAAIKFSLKRLLAMGYDFVGLVENDIELKPGWLDAMMAAWLAAEQDGLKVGAATARSIHSRVYAHTPRYVVQWNMGAAMVLFSRAGAEAVLEYYSTTTAREIHDFYQQTLGLELSDRWELFMEKPDRSLGADWLFAASALRRGLVSVGTIPFLAENFDVNLEEVCGTKYIYSADDPMPAGCLSISQVRSALSAANPAAPANRLRGFSTPPNIKPPSPQPPAIQNHRMNSLTPTATAEPRPVVGFPAIIQTATSVKTLERLYSVYSAMERSAAQPPDGYRDAQGLSNAGYCSAKQILAAVFELSAPRNYLEIGTRRGHSLCLAACSAPRPFDVYSFDMWIPNYGGEENPGPDLVRGELAKFGFQGKFNVSLGDSQKTVPAFFANPANPQLFDVIYVDGDHTDEGACRDLENVVAHLAPGGFLLFDDITHPKHLTLLKVWQDFMARHPELEDAVDTEHEYGWALARRRHTVPGLPELSIPAIPVAQTVTRTHSNANGASLNGKNGAAHAAANGVTHGTMGVATESAFARALKQVIADHRPRRLIETGTHVGAGTTTIIASALRQCGLDGASFHSIEVNPLFYLRANVNLRKSGLDRFARLHNGLSIPRNLLPQAAEIEAAAAEAKNVPGVFIDHEEARRVALYLAETKFDGVQDDLLGRCLAEFDYKPDFLLLDSAGHMGFVEFQYVLQLIKSPCILALDDVNHLKHYLTLRHIRTDARFKILAESNEKYGFCITEFTPTPAAPVDTVWISQYVDRLMAPAAPSAPAVPQEILEAYHTWKKSFPAGTLPTDSRPIESLLGSHPQHGEFYTDLGLILRAAGRPHQARLMFEHAVRFSPQDIRGWRELARHFYCDVHNPALALAIYQASLAHARFSGTAESLIEQQSGFHSWEGDYCWLDREASLIVHTGRLDFPAELEFTLTGADAWCYGGRPVPVTISNGNSVLRNLVFVGNQHREKVVLPLPAGTGAEPIKIESSVAFVPSQITRNSQDTRRLAIRISGLALHPKVPTDSVGQDGLVQFLAGSIH